MIRPLTMMTWVSHAWDPMTGCTKISEGCAHCTAEYQCIKFGYQTWDRTQFRPTLHPREFMSPIWEQESRSILIAPQGEFFHEAFPISTLHFLLDIMREAPWHFYYLLTKRHKRMHETLMSYKNWPIKNVNIGVSTENQKWLNERLPVLLEIPVHDTAHRFLSCEPILSSVVIGPRLRNLGAVICGPERGRSLRTTNPEWLEDLRTECLMVGVPFFHHGSGIIEREQRPKSDVIFHEQQCIARLMEYHNGNEPLLPRLREIARREDITMTELCRRIGPATKYRAGSIKRGIVHTSAYKKIREYIDNYYKGEKHAACG
jgi:protein gp37